MHHPQVSSWFGIYGSVLSWFKSYLSSRCFRVKCDDNLSSFHTFSCGVFTEGLFSALYSSSRTPHLSVLLSLLFSSTTTITQMILSSSSLFTHSTFDSSISHLQNAFLHISSWMTANLLTLSSFKTEFLLIGLKNQLAKIHNSSLDTSHSARNFDFVFDEHLTFADQITVLSKACYYHIRQLHCIRPYLDLSTSYYLYRSLQT